MVLGDFIWRITRAGIAVLAAVDVLVQSVVSLPQTRDMQNESQELLKEVREQLNLVLGFFSRVDAKASVVLAINTGMLAVLASNAPPLTKEHECG